MRVKDTSILRADTVSGVICSEMESYLKRADYQENFEWFDGYVQGEHMRRYEGSIFMDI